MGGTAAIAVGSMLLGPKIMQATGLAPEPPAPLVVEQPTQQMQSPPASPQSSQQAQQVSAQQRKRAQGTTGRSDTIKTGPGGLGEVPAENQQVKSLLGY